VNAHGLTVARRGSPSDAPAGRRVLTSAALGLAAGIACAALAPWQVADLCGWDVASLLFLTRIWWIIRPLDAKATEKWADREDASTAVADLVVVSAATACIAGAGLTLLHAGKSAGGTKAAMIALAALSVVLAWAAVHTVFTLRYARLYYSGEDGGIDFNARHDEAPCYLDFAYVAFTVGMTFQVSDTDITDLAVRRTILRHALLSFVFGAMILGMTINIVAGLLA